MGEPKYRTIAIDSAGELARLYFSKDMGKVSKDMEKIRAMNNYPGVTERLNMLVRRLKNFRDKGIEIVFTAHEDIQKIYAKGGAMAGKGQAPQDPAAIKGWPDLPGTRTPDEFCRAADNVLHVRWVNGKPTWIARREPIATGNEYWEVKTRFNAQAIMSGLLPANYEELAKAASAGDFNWNPPYIWVLYGPFGIEKTRSLRFFPKPMILFDLDKGSNSLSPAELAGITVVNDIDPEEGNDYNKFVSKLEACYPL